MHRDQHLRQALRIRSMEKADKVKYSKGKSFLEVLMKQTHGPNCSAGYFSGVLSPLLPLKLVVYFQFHVP